MIDFSRPRRPARFGCAMLRRWCSCRSITKSTKYYLFVHPQYFFYSRSRQTFFTRHNKMKIGQSLLFLFTICLAIYLVLCLTFPKRENYGGIVKNVRKIPMSDCYQRCDIWAANCARDRPGDEYRCRQMGEACRAECYYSNSHRQ